ncbi:MAG: hypothetical protein U5Q16_16095 [Gammaproteobacteria bacterium]|nr:hypothetical protein [Gammaproteobacteria bacterium]
MLGGSTLALGADLLATAFDATNDTRALSPVGVEMERQGLDWIKELLGLPAAWSGVMVTGCHHGRFRLPRLGPAMVGEEHGVDAPETGMGGMPAMPVLTSGFASQH